MHKLIHHVSTLLLFFCLVYAGIANANINRKDVLSLLQSLDAVSNQSALNLWINDSPTDPQVKVGDTLKYTIESSSANFLLIILVDPKGSTSIVFPDFLISRSPKRYRHFDYPPPITGFLTQGEPAGTETVLAIAMEKPLTPKQLGFSGESDIEGLGNDQIAIRNFVRTFNSLVAGTSVNIVREQYVVDADVQISSRAFRRELAARLQQVNVLENNALEKGKDVVVDSVPETVIESEPLAASDITFETGSDTLTDMGRTQLDVFGSELVYLWENDSLPRITLEGHTDDRGSASYNQQLSERRSEAAKRYLLNEYGLPEQSIGTRGMGESKPIASNATAESRSTNRRVEIRVAR